MQAEQKLVYELALHFASGISSQLGPDIRMQVNAANKLTGDQCCATHEYCDPNEIMAEAFFRVFKRHPELINANGYTEDATIWNTAWTIARYKRFDISEFNKQQS